MYPLCACNILPTYRTLSKLGRIIPYFFFFSFFGKTTQLKTRNLFAAQLFELLL